ncbi:trypco2 family protein [Streptomyces sp. NPDC016566]|uniref:trypco2 family protein n=1 Tax=Streptomyces sp. NPDC016566 TaxID=3364967 RepID=UPI0036F8BC0A
MAEEQGNGLQLAQMISALRDELAQAQYSAAGEQLRFSVSGIEVEATIQVTKEHEGKGGVKFWVVEAGGSLKGGNSTTQRIKLSLTVPDDFRVADRERPVK